MLRRYARDPLDLDEMADAERRKMVFRELGRELSQSIRERALTDTPGTVARLLEKAFRAGVELGREQDFDIKETDTRRDITDIDVPPRPRERLNEFRMALRVPVWDRTSRSNGIRCRPVPCS